MFLYKEHQVIYVKEDIPDRNLSRNEIGTIVYVYTGGVYEIEFPTSDKPKLIHLRHNQIALKNEN
jgi:hypothetical protein